MTSSDDKIREAGKKEAATAILKIVGTNTPFAKIQDEIELHQNEYPILSCYSEIGRRNTLSAVLKEKGYYVKKESSGKAFVSITAPLPKKEMWVIIDGKKMGVAMSKVYTTLKEMKKEGITKFTADEVNIRSNTKSFFSLYYKKPALLPLYMDNTQKPTMFSFVELPKLQSVVYPLETKERAPCLPDNQDLIIRAINNNGAANVSALNGIRVGYENLATKLDENNKLLTQIRDVSESKLYHVLEAIERQQDEIYQMWKRIETKGLEKERVEKQILDLQTEMLQEEKKKMETKNTSNLSPLNISKDWGKSNG